MGTDVFISYCRENAADADRICQFLEENKLSCWIAPRNIPGGMEWPEAIVEGIKGSRILLVLLSVHTARSKQIGRELTLASDNDLTVITVRLDDVQAPDKLQYFTSNLQWIDAFGDRFNDGMAKLIATLRYQLGRPQTPVSPKIRFTASPQQARVKKSSTGKKVAIGALLAFFVLGLIGYFSDASNRQGPNPGTAMTPAVSATQATTDANATSARQPASRAIVPATSDEHADVADSSPPPEQHPAGASAATFANSTAGVWAGSYVCGGFANQAQLTLVSEGAGGLHGILQFNAAPQPGSYYVRGNVNPANASVMLKYAGWYYRPPGNWVPLDIDAQVDLADGIMTGRLQSSVCTAFELHKIE